MSIQAEFELSSQATAALEEVSRRENIAFDAVLRTASALVLGRLSGEDEPRVHEEIETRAWLKTGIESSPSPLVLNAGATPRDVIRIAYDPTRFSAGEIARFSRCLIAVIERLPAQLSQRLAVLDIVPAAERERALSEWNETAVEYPARKCVHELIEEQAERTPDAIAVVFEDRQVTYRELESRANLLARRLMKRGVGPETLAGICMGRSPELLIGMLAILKAGAAYVPLDPSFPRRRLGAMLADSGIKTVLTEKLFAGDLIPAEIDAVLVDGESKAAEPESAERPSRTASPDGLAYVIYTSGSTGKPKGVMVEHRNVVNFFTAMDQVVGCDPSGVWLAVTSVSFDISVLELLWTLARGFRVILSGDDPSHARGGKYSIASLLREHNVTHLQCTPSLARMLASDPDSLHEMTRLRKLLLGGEALPVSLVEQLRPLIAGEIHNMYGPTETTVWSTTHRVSSENGTSANTVPIGKPIANTEVYILDSKLRPVPPGVTGELFIGGAGVVRGYLNLPDLTAERFLPDSFRPERGGRIYRTGDVARHLPDGAIEYLGRSDHQVKIRGFRIELGEIETALERYPEVRQVVVVAREDKAGDKRLVAYMVLQPGQNPAPSQLRRHLESSLPDYMLPSAFVALDRLPLTANGKIDRTALPAPEGREMREQALYAAPRKGFEKAIADAWQEALGVERVGLYDNFFDLGAHSLLVAEVHIQLRQVLERDFPLLDMFRHPTVHALAEHLNGEPAQPAQQTADRGQARRESMSLRLKRRGTGVV